MMNFDEFVKGLTDNIKSYLPEWYEDATVEVIDMHKLNESYTGLRVSLPDEKVAPCINLNAAYDVLLDGMDLRDVVAQMVNAITSPTPHVNVSAILDYESIKEKLFIRVSNAEKNQDMLENLPHTMMDDLAITYHILFEKGNGGIASIPINEGLLDKYGVTLEQLHEDALKSSPEVLPLRTKPVSSIMKNVMQMEMERAGCDEKEIYEAMLLMCPETGLHVVTNQVGVNGASAIFYPGIMDEFTEKLGGNYFIIPSSTDEVLVLADNGEMSIAQINAMIQEINETKVEEELRLSNEVYYYDASEKVFERASVHEEKMQQKAVDKDSIMKKLDEKKKEITDTVKDSVTPKRVAEASL